jgi:beta-glucosidase
MFRITALATFALGLQACQLQPGMNCKGYDMNSAPGADANACCALCKTTTGCAAFTHDQWSSSGAKTPTCYLKSACPSVESNPNSVAGTLSSGPSFCGGEYSLCTDGSCALLKSSCGKCKPGQYACPISSTCIDDLTAYSTCPGLKGTYLDASLSEDSRLDLLVKAVTPSDMIAQLVNNAPTIESQHLPAYNYLNDNEHGVKGTAHATVYPMGVSTGASWSKELTHEVGAAIGVESRSTHNAQADKSGNSCGSTSTGKVVANGCGITLYAPNINLVR